MMTNYFYQYDSGAAVISRHFVALSISGQWTSGPGLPHIGVIIKLPPG